MLIEAVLVLQRNSKETGTVLGTTDDYYLDEDRALINIALDVPESIFKGPTIKFHIKEENLPSIQGQVLDVEVPVKTEYFPSNKEEVCDKVGFLATIKKFLFERK